VLRVNIWLVRRSSAIYYEINIFCLPEFNLQHFAAFKRESVPDFMAKKPVMWTHVPLSFRTIIMTPTVAVWYSF